MGSEAIRRNRVAGIWTAVVVVVIAVVGCHITDNPPKSLHVAAFKGNKGAVMSFLKDGATPDARGQDGERPLHFAVYGDRIGDIVKCCG